MMRPRKCPQCGSLSLLWGAACDECTRKWRAGEKQRKADAARKAAEEQARAAQRKRDDAVLGTHPDLKEVDAHLTESAPHWF